MPRTGKAPDGTPQGLDVAVAQRLGRILGRTVEFHWCASPECGWHCLPEGRCDVVIGQPRRLRASRETWPGAFPMPAPSSGWWSRARSRAVQSLADLRGKRVGIVTGTVALSEKDHAVVRFKSREELLEGFGPRRSTPRSSTPTSPPGTCTRIPSSSSGSSTEYVPRERWNMALAVRAKDAQLLVEINRALAQLAESGELRKIYDDHGRAVPRPASRRPAGNRHHPTPGIASASGASWSSAWTPPTCPTPAPRKIDRGSMSSWHEPWPNGFTSSCASNGWISIARPRSGDSSSGGATWSLGEAVAPNTVADDEELAGKILYSRPYYGTGYVLVQAQEWPARSVARGAEGSEVAAAGHGGRVGRRLSAPTAWLPAASLSEPIGHAQGLDDGDIDYAYLWANVGWTLHVSPDLSKLELVPSYDTGGPLEYRGRHEHRGTRSSSGTSTRRSVP